MTKENNTELISYHSTIDDANEIIAGVEGEDGIVARDIALIIMAAGIISYLLDL